MSARRTIIDNIVNDVREKVTVANGYNVEPVRVYGELRNPEKVTQFPSIAIGMFSDVLVEEGNGYQRRDAEILIYGYVNNVDHLFDLSEDLEDFFYKRDGDFVYKNQILPTTGEGVNFRYGGVSESQSVYTFDFTFSVRYTVNIN
jgi:hypothetical protein